MEHAPDNAVGLAVSPDIRSEPATLHAGQAPQGLGQPTIPAAESVYLIAARKCAARWTEICGHAPWTAGAPKSTIPSKIVPPRIYKEQSAALALAVLCELDHGRRDEAYLRETTRHALIRWQFSLCGDGRPKGRAARRSQLHGASLWQVLLTISETSGFQTDLLLTDVERHLSWIAKRTVSSSWLEAAAICALAEGSVLVRQSEYLAAARTRLANLLLKQDEEGWFPESGAVDFGRLSLTIDALARLYTQTKWPELVEPLRETLRFIEHFVHSDGSVGGCYGLYGTAFLSPYGLELLAPIFPEAEKLATITRAGVARFDDHAFGRWPDDLCAAWGASLALAATVNRKATTSDLPEPRFTSLTQRFPNAGLSIFTTNTYKAVVADRQGGAIRVSWRNGAIDLEDPGVTVVFPHRVRTAGRHNRRTKTNVTSTTLTTRGILRRVKSSPDSVRQRAVRFIRKLKLWGRGDSRPPKTGQPRPHEYRRLAHDWFERRFEFLEEGIRIHDEVLCRLPCETIICQSACPESASEFAGAGASSRTLRPPLFVEGGRRVEIIRTYRNGTLLAQQP